MTQEEFDSRVRDLFAEQEHYILQPNEKLLAWNGIYTRYKKPILTRDHAPIHWCFDLNIETNPNLQQRLGVNTTFNAGAIQLNGRYYMIVRVESYDVKSFFAVAESQNGVDGWRFWNRPIVMPSHDEAETNVYDIRLTHHEDGWIYGLFCSERKDKTQPKDSSAALASCGIARTKDLKTWERLPDLQSTAPQQRNCVLHPEFVDGKYMIYTRPQGGFIDTGNSGISVGFTGSMEKAVVGEETIIDARQYHTYKEVKNGQGPPPIKTEKGWLHLAHGVRHTASGLRYVLYLFMTSLDNPTKVIHRPSGHLLSPLQEERVGDVDNVVFSNGWVKNEKDEVFIYYASSDTRMHVATSSIELLVDYCTNTPEDAGRTELCVKQRDELVLNNLSVLKEKYPDLYDAYMQD